MVPGNGDRVESWHIFGLELKNIAYDPHGHLRRVDVGVTHHEFLENIILDGSSEVFVLGSLLEGSRDVHGHDWKHCSVHGHRYGNLVQRDLVEQDLHVFNRVNSYSSHTNVACDALVVGVIASVSGEIESH